MVRFYYYLFGQDVGALTVMSRGVVDGELTWEGVAAYSGDNGQVWLRGSAQVHPNHKDGVFQFVFKAKNKNIDDIHPDIEGDIAVDDISFSKECTMTSSTLPPTQPTTTPGEECLETEVSCMDDASTCIAKKKLCDFATDCPNGFDEV